MSKFEYTKELLDTLKQDYAKATNDEERKAVVKAFAEKHGVPEHSVIMKLVSEKVYISPKRTTKNGRKIETKDQMVARLEDKLKLNPGDLASLEKATKLTIQRLLDNC